MRPSSHPKALTTCRRTKHRRQTVSRDTASITATTITIPSLRPPSIVGRYQIRRRRWGEKETRISQSSLIVLDVTWLCPAVACPRLKRRDSLDQFAGKSKLSPRSTYKRPGSTVRSGVSTVLPSSLKVPAQFSCHCKIFATIHAYSHAMDDSQLGVLRWPASACLLIFPRGHCQHQYASCALTPEFGKYTASDRTASVNTVLQRPWYMFLWTARNQKNLGRIYKRKLGAACRFAEKH